MRSLLLEGNEGDMHRNMRRQVLYLTECSSNVQYITCLLPCLFARL